MKNETEKQIKHNIYVVLFQYFSREPAIQTTDEIMESISPLFSQAVLEAKRETLGQIECSRHGDTFRSYKMECEECQKARGIYLRVSKTLSTQAEKEENGS